MARSGFKTPRPLVFPPTTQFLDFTNQRMLEAQVYVKRHSSKSKSDFLLIESIDPLCMQNSNLLSDLHVGVLPHLCFKTIKDAFKLFNPLFSPLSYSQPSSQLLKTMRGSMITAFCIGVFLLSTVDGSGQIYCQRGFKHPGNPQYELDLSKFDQ
jgi:hypothetical protein